MAGDHGVRFATPELPKGRVPAVGSPFPVQRPQLSWTLRRLHRASVSQPFSEFPPVPTWFAGGWWIESYRHSECHREPVFSRYVIC